MRTTAGGLALLLLSLWACSWSSDLAVLNRSSATIVVSYRVRPGAWSPGATTWDNPPPAILPITGLSANPDWPRLPAADYGWDPDSNTVTVRLPPGMALRFGRVINRERLPADGTAPELAVTSLRVLVGEEFTALDPPQAFPLFKRRSRFLYTLSTDDLPLGAP